MTSAVVNHFETGPKTYEVVEEVKAGQVVEYRSGTATQAGLSLVGVAGAGSTKVAGVATRYANTKANLDAMQSSTSADGGYPISYAPRASESVAVIKRGEVPVKYAAAANYGDKLKAAASGQVTPWVRGTDSVELIIGSCQVQGGVALGATDFAWIGGFVL